MANNPPIQLIPDTPPPANVVEMLEEYLTRAKAGEFSSVALALVDREGRGITDWTERPNLCALRGSAARLLHRLCGEIN